MYYVFTHCELFRHIPAIRMWQIDMQEKSQKPKAALPYAQCLLVQLSSSSSLCSREFLQPTIFLSDRFPNSQTEAAGHRVQQLWLRPSKSQPHGTRDVHAIVLKTREAIANCCQGAEGATQTLSLALLKSPVHSPQLGFRVTVPHGTEMCFASNWANETA